MATVHLGDLLVSHGVLTTAQRDAILEAQQTRGGPFGALAEQMFGVSPQAVERAWAEQYSHIAPHVDPNTFNVNPRALELVSKRQAWQFGVLPLEIRGRTLVCCTDQAHLPRALKFAGWRLAHAVEFLICETDQLARALDHHYPMPGFDAAEMLRTVGIAG